MAVWLLDCPVQSKIRCDKRASLSFSISKSYLLWRKHFIEIETLECKLMPRLYSPLLAVTAHPPFKLSRLSTDSIIICSLKSCCGTKTGLATAPDSSAFLFTCDHLSLLPILVWFCFIFCFHSNFLFGLHKFWSRILFPAATFRSSARPKTQNQKSRINQNDQPCRLEQIHLQDAPGCEQVGAMPGTGVRQSLVRYGRTVQASRPKLNQTQKRARQRC